MKILYLSCHEGLQHDEVGLFEELGHEVEVIAHYGVVNRSKVEPRPNLRGVNLTNGSLDLRLNPDYVKQFDMVYFTHYFEWIMANWHLVKGKPAVLRIWQSEHQDVNSLASYRKDGLVIVRYSELTSYGLVNASPHDCVIRAYKDPDEFSGWNGNEKFVMTTSNDIASRPQHCYLGTFQRATDGLPRKLFGRNNEALAVAGGFVTYDQLKTEYRNNAAYLYLGTHPAPYTLNFIEAFMTGAPVVSIGTRIADISGKRSSEMSEFIVDGINGFISDDERVLRANLKELLDNPALAKKIGDAGRETAIEVFGKQSIKKQWDALFRAIA